MTASQAVGALSGGGPLPAEYRRWRLRRFGVLALAGAVLGVTGALITALLPRGSAVHGVAAALAGLGVGLIVVAGLAAGADCLR